MPILLFPVATNDRVSDELLDWQRGHQTNRVQVQTQCPYHFTTFCCSFRSGRLYCGCHSQIQFGQISLYHISRTVRSRWSTLRFGDQRSWCFGKVCICFTTFGTTSLLQDRSCGIGIAQLQTVYNRCYFGSLFKLVWQTRNEWRFVHELRWAIDDISVCRCDTNSDDNFTNSECFEKNQPFIVRICKYYIYTQKQNVI